MKKAVLCLMAVLLVSAPALGQGYDFLVRQAEDAMEEKAYQKALELYEKAFQSGEFHFNDYIHAAGASARTGQEDQAFTYLNQALEAGYGNLSFLAEIPALKPLHSDPRWENLMEKGRKLIAARQSEFPDKHSEDVVFDLPDPDTTGTVSVEEAIASRRSTRFYADVPLEKAELSQILWAAYGITRTYEGMPAFLRGGLRAAPSAGARYPLDVYVAVRKVNGVPPGIYWYKSETHKLIQISSDDKWQDLSEAAFHQPHFKTAAAALVYSAIFQRAMEKYGQRARERYVWIDLGHSGENVYLQAHALGIGTCAIGAFTDLWLKEVIGMTRDEEPLYIMPLGRMENR